MIKNDIKKSLLILFLCFSSILSYAQDSKALNAERFPVFSTCENLEGKALESCFYNEVQEFVFQKLWQKYFLQLGSFQTKHSDFLFRE